MADGAIPAALKVTHRSRGAISVEGGQKSIAISPSYFNSLALAKGQTTHKGPVVTTNYKPSGVRVIDDDKLDLPKLRALEETFKSFSYELHEFKKSVAHLIRTSRKPSSELPS